MLVVFVQRRTGNSCGTKIWWPKFYGGQNGAPLILTVVHHGMYLIDI